MRCGPPAPRGSPAAPDPEPPPGPYVVTDFQPNRFLRMERNPDFRWDRLKEPIRKQDLPRLITVQTVLDYLESRRAA